MPTLVATIATDLLAAVATLAWRWRILLWRAAVLVVLVIVIVLGAAVVALATGVGRTSIASCSS